jgi:hypothetical protein
MQGNSSIKFAFKTWGLMLLFSPLLFGLFMAVYQSSSLSAFFMLFNFVVFALYSVIALLVGIGLLYILKKTRMATQKMFYSLTLLAYTVFGVELLLGEAFKLVSPTEKWAFYLSLTLPLLIAIYAVKLRKSA